MSSNELQIPYETPLIKIAKTARGFDTLARALWMMYAVIILAFGCAGVTNLFHGPNPLLDPLSQSMGMTEWQWLVVLTGLILFATFTLGVIGKALFPVIASAQLELGDDYLSLPVSCALSARFNLRRRWSDIATFSVIDGRQLSLQFKGSGSATLVLSLIPEQLRELVRLTFDIKCGAGDKDAFLNSAAGKEQHLVKVWHTVVNQRFRAPMFKPLKAGETLQDGHLVIRHLIGSKEFTATYLGQQPDSGLFVIKEVALPEAVAANARRARSNMKRELEAPLNDEAHRVMRVIDFFKEQDRDYIVYEYAAGECVRDIVCQCGPLDEKTALQWCAQVTAILETLHKSEPVIVHCNLSPDDLILNDDKIHLVDCGTANRYITTATHGFAGKPPYSAPEYLRGKRDPGNDVYSLGAILYFLLTGKDPQPLSSYTTSTSAPVQQLLGQLTQTQVDRRIQSAQEASSRINDVLATIQRRAVRHD